MSEAWTVNSDYKCKQFHLKVDELYAQHKHVTFDWTTGRQRTNQQRKAIEVYCRELASALNAAGFDQRKTMLMMRDGVEIPWSQSAVKDSLWREIQKAVVDKESTTQLEKAEVSRVYDILNRWTSEKMGVSILFPEAAND